MLVKQDHRVSFPYMRKASSSKTLLEDKPLKPLFFPCLPSPDSDTAIADMSLVPNEIYALFAGGLIVGAGP